MSLQSIKARRDSTYCCPIKETPGILHKAPVSSINVNIGRLHAIPYWDAASPTSSDSDDLVPSLTEAEWADLENHQISSWKLTPLRSKSENISETLPSEFHPFLLSHPICPWHPQYRQTDVTVNRHSWTPSHVGHQTTLPNAGSQSPAGQHYTRTPLPHCIFQPPAGQYYTWPLPHGEIHYPKDQHVDQMSSRVKYQLHYHWYPSLGASGMVPPSNVSYPYVTNTGPYYHWYPSLGPSGMVPPSNVTYPYATNTGSPPDARSHPPANAFITPPEHDTV